MFKREVIFYPAFDKRDPNPAMSYGIHGAEMKFYLHGPKGVVQFVLFTGWHLPHVRKELKSISEGLLAPMPADLGYHSYVPLYEGQESMGTCDLLNGELCYYDGSGLAAQSLFDLLISKGSDAVWKAMESRYEEIFKNVNLPGTALAKNKDDVVRRLLIRK